MKAVKVKCLKRLIRFKIVTDIASMILISIKTGIDKI